MKIIQLLSGFQLPLTNEEQEFYNHYDEVRIQALNEHDQWIAQNLVRKGVYSISKDSETISKN